MVNAMQLFKIVLMVQLFYSFAITGLSYSMPADALTYTEVFQGADESTTLESVAGNVEDSLQSQKNIPVIELGALVFYSGNIILDLIVNFLFALPQMIGMLINGVMLLMNVDSYLFALIEIFFSVVISIFYLIGLMEMLLSVRSGRSIA